MSEIVWEDPKPAAPGRPSVWRPFVEELQRHPGKWAIARDKGENSTVYSMLQRRLKAFGCEATSRKQSDGTFTLYARWPEVAS